MKPKTKQQTLELSFSSPKTVLKPSYRSPSQPTTPGQTAELAVNITSHVNPKNPKQNNEKRRGKKNKKSTVTNPNTHKNTHTHTHTHPFSTRD